MSFGDNLVGTETIYKGVKMRSKLESKVALFLDSLNIRWIYEPKTFMLSNGIRYKPDFYLPELKTWIEVKGKIEEHNKTYSKLFVKDNKQELILISNKQVFYYSNWFGEEEPYEDNRLQIGFCSTCKKYFFCDMLGSYHCRNCGIHEGDHDIISVLGEESSEGVLDFYDNEELKRWLKRHGSKI